MNVAEGGGRAGWWLLRQSLHDPLLVLNVESEAAGGVAKKQVSMAAAVQHESELESKDLGVAAL